MTQMNLRHFGDPCVHCGTRHDDVAVGACDGDPSKAVAIAYRSLGVRWDGYETFLVRFSDGQIKRRVGHVSEHLPYWHFEPARYHEIRQPPRYDQSLTEAAE